MKYTISKETRCTKNQSLKFSSSDKLMMKNHLVAFLVLIFHFVMSVIGLLDITLSELRLSLQRYPPNEVKILGDKWYNLSGNNYLAQTTDSFTNGTKVEH